MPYAIYILKCSDGTYYKGLTKDLNGRLLEHQAGAIPESYTFRRRPVKLVWSIVTESCREAFQWEHRIKGWSRAKNEAPIHGGIEGIHEIVKTERKRREKNTRAERSDKRSEERRRSANNQRN